MRRTTILVVAPCALARYLQSSARPLSPPALLGVGPGVELHEAAFLLALAAVGCQGCAASRDVSLLPLLQHRHLHLLARTLLALAREAPSC
jgi:hypothetical protein